MSSRSITLLLGTGLDLLTVPFPFLDRSHVLVIPRTAAERDAGLFFSDENALEEGTQYTWISDGQVQLATPADGTTDYLVKRDTPVLALATQAPGVFSSEKVNLAVQQALYLSEEAQDAVNETNPDLAAAESASLAATQAALATAARLLAEAARDEAEGFTATITAALLAEAYYKDTTLLGAVALGEAGTVDGDYFTVIADDIDYVALYLNTGGVGGEVFRLATPAALDALEALVLSSISGLGVEFSKQVTSQAVASYDASLVLSSLSTAVRVDNGLSKAWDVVPAVADANHEIAQGTPLAGIAVWVDGDVGVTAEKLLGEVYLRSTGNTGVPGTGDDALIASTGFLPYDSSIGYYPLQTAGQQLVLPFADDLVLETVAGTRLMFVVRAYLDDEVTRATLSWRYTTLAAPSDNALLGYKEDPADTWAIESGVRSPRIGPLTPEAIDLAATYARAYSTVPLVDTRLEDDLLSARMRATMSPSFLATHRFPIVATTASGGEEGLARLLGRPLAGDYPKYGVLGEHFGLRTPAGSLTDGLTKYPDYVDAGGLRVGDNTNFNGPHGWVLESFKLLDKRLQAEDVTAPCLVDDAFFDYSLGGYTRAVDHSGSGLLTLRRCEIKGGSSGTVFGACLSIEQCYIHEGGGDCLKGGTTEVDYPLRRYDLWATLVRLPSYTLHPDYVTSAHGDAAQVGDLHNSHWLGSIIYHPDALSKWFEPVDGSTVNAVRMVQDDRRQDVYFGGSIFAGANSALGWGMNEDAVYGRSIVVYNSILGTGDGANAYNQFASIDLSWRSTAGPAVVDLSNWFFFNLFGHDGQDVTLGGNMLSTTPPAGITDARDAPEDGPKWAIPYGKYLAMNYDYEALTDQMHQFLLEYQAAMGVSLILPDGTPGPDLILGTFLQPS